MLVRSTVVLLWSYVYIEASFLMSTEQNKKKTTTQNKNNNNSTQRGKRIWISTQRMKMKQAENRKKQLQLPYCTDKVKFHNGKYRKNID